jgi:hypothetical protein
MRNVATRITALVASIATAAMVFGSFGVQPVYAAASMYVTTGSSSYAFGDVITVNINVNTGGQSANAFQANFSYPASLLEGVSGTFSGSVCTLPITVPDPSGGTTSFSCGRPSGYNGIGTVARVTLKVIAQGVGSLNISGCEVLANDGLGTNITGGCSGSTVTTLGPSPSPTIDPNYVPSPTPTPKPKKSPTPTPSPTIKPSSSATINIGGQTTPTPTITPPPIAELAPGETPPPPTEEPTPEPEVEEEVVQKRTVGQAIQDIFSASRNIGKLGGNLTGVVALLIAVVPFLALLLAILYLAYRLYMMERRRKRTLDRLFEMELAELAALEGKLDLLGEKGSKGKAQYQEEFKRAKENILRQLKPDFAKPVDGGKKSKDEPKENEKK